VTLLGSARLAQSAVINQCALLCCEVHGRQGGLFRVQLMTLQKLYPSSYTKVLVYMHKHFSHRRSHLKSTAAYRGTMDTVRTLLLSKHWLVCKSKITG
jgi:hypothetical protein